MNRRLFICSAIAMTSPPVQAIAADQRMVDAGELYQLTGSGHGDNRAVYMPDGNRIVFASMRTGKSQLWSIHPDGNALSRLHQSNANDFGRVATYLDGTHISFSSDRDGRNAIYVLDMASGNLTRVSDLQWWSFGPTWSSTNLIAYFSRKGGNKLNIWTVSPDGSNTCQMTNRPGESRQPWWSSDGKRIAYSANAGTNGFQIWTCGPNGEDPTRINNRGDWQQPFWSPDGRRLAVSARSGTAHFKIMTIDVDSGDVRLIRQPPLVDNVHPAWSPDGKHIVFTSGMGHNSYLSQFSFA
ncbi:PD40 domain-containing protein [Paraburkholderia solisilvae]|uniref:Tol-Pal system protein TolB n=1 Tax=Paraburkholderia solisilvae TaxID=624376 RepID=A0A6J5ER53_9BURK|nr:PD40 domain-containing protein [Paraburkholderia solisilvae]CAB3767485.1 Tol-Pal system protein TolB [Paraburkholderia solisilvae]